MSFPVSNLRLANSSMSEHLLEYQIVMQKVYSKWGSERSIRNATVLPSGAGDSLRPDFL